MGNGLFEFLVDRIITMLEDKREIQMIEFPEDKGYSTEKARKEHHKLYEQEREKRKAGKEYLDISPLKFFYNNQLCEKILVYKENCQTEKTVLYFAIYEKGQISQRIPTEGARITYKLDDKPDLTVLKGK